MATPDLKMWLNEHGVLVSEHKCDWCGVLFTMTPAVEDTEWGGCCLSKDCPSYDPARDLDKEFGFEPDDPESVGSVPYPCER